jgi:hypothetical protein
MLTKPMMEGSIIIFFCFDFIIWYMILQTVSDIYGDCVLYCVVRMSVLTELIEVRYMVCGTNRGRI